MALYKPGNSPFWYFDITVRGNRIRRSTETDERELAEIVEAKARHDALLGTIIERKPTMTLDAAAGRYWLEHASALKSQETVKYQIRQLRDGIGRDTELGKITDRAVSTYVARRRGMKAYRRKGTVSDTSVNREIDLLRALMRTAAERWGVEVGVVNWRAQRLREPGPRDRYLSPEEAERLIGCAAEHIKPLIRFSLLTGVRLSNVATLDWSQVDLGRRLIDLRLKSIRRDGKPHVLPMPDALFLLLANLGPKDKGPVFTRKGRALKDWRHGWYAALERAGIRDFRWHDLRHTAASWMVQGGAPLDVVQDVLGHENIKTTQRYAHRDAGAKLAALEAASSFSRHTEAAETGQVADLKGKKASA